jgi:hypothetical protein
MTRPSRPCQRPLSALHRLRRMAWSSAGTVTNSYQPRWGIALTCFVTKGDSERPLDTPIRPPRRPLGANPTSRARGARHCADT